MKIPVRHHYIPQFILKNFCFDENRHFNYYDIQNNEFSVQETSNVFMVRNLYRDEVNYQDNPVQLENDLSKYEMEVSKIFKDKFLESNSFKLTIDEDERIKLFLAIMPYRSKTTREQFSNFGEENDEYDKLIKNGETFEEVWIRNLEKIVNCRSLDEVIRRSDIDDIIKSHMMRDSFGIMGRYFIVAERRGSEDFFISDCYPVTAFYMLDNGFRIPLLSYYPIAPSRVVILSAYGMGGLSKIVQDYDDNFLRKPVIVPNSNHYQFTVRKLYEDKVKMINKNMYEATKAIGGNIAFKERERISIFKEA